ncbi:Alpha-1,3-mannosyltransferase [Thalictrum thalictroides]|uniref:Alpha-1,3-mannosyltransferase n=1 Tax=Thalictrum thalictroides TaxID=46969 RepID=A0A7J6VPL6_THATH|nr:Alpha-1,3-mannosyltransferase [Thalictrum thalictroides]
MMLSLYKQGFRRAPASDLPESRSLYLNSVLTHRSGSAVMLSLIYSEILKMLRLWGLLDFDVEISCPHDQVNLPKGYHKQKSRVSDQPSILTQQSLLVEILRSLKEVFWPFRYDPSRSLFLRAALAAKCISGPNTTEETAFERASTKAAQHRLERGVWTSVRLGDMRRALSASERLILLDYNVDELRDYSILLYHCGFYEESWHYLSLYMNTTISSKPKRFTSKLKQMEDDAVEELKTRLNLILMEDNLTKPSNFRNFLGSHSEPW